MGTQLCFSLFLGREATFLTASLHPSLTRPFQIKVYSLKNILLRDQVLSWKSCSKMKDTIKLIQSGYPEPQRFILFCHFFL